MTFARHPMIWILIMAGVISSGSESWAAKPRRHVQRTGGSVDHAITQIPASANRLSGRGDIDLSANSLANCPAARRGKCRVLPEPDLASALIEAPSAATEELLAQLGIPAIPDVPPIVILSPQGAKPLKGVAAHLGF